MAAGSLPSSRIEILDALRGFALSGILIVHFLEQYYGGTPPVGHENYADFSAVDPVLNGITGFFLRGKFFMLFAFFFGVGFNLQLSRQTYGNQRNNMRFIWRMAVLLVIGFFHQMVYRGDILIAYSLLALPLLYFRALPDRWLWITAAVLMLGVPRFIQTVLGIGTDYEAQLKQTQMEEILYWEMAKNGSWLDLAWQNSTYGLFMKWQFQFGHIGRAYQTFALFLLGISAGRMRLFEGIAQKEQLYKKGFLWSVAAFFGVLTLGVMLLGGLKEVRPSSVWIKALRFTLSDLLNMSMASIYLFVFLLLARQDWWHWQALKLAPFGRMALTNYILQSLIGTAIVFGYGLGLLGEISSTSMIAIGIAVFYAQCMGSAWWLRHYYYGPAEWLWRSATFGKWYPLKRNDTVVENLEY